MNKIGLLYYGPNPILFVLFPLPRDIQIFSDFCTALLRNLGLCNAEISEEFKLQYKAIGPQKFKFVRKITYRYGTFPPIGIDLVNH